MDLRPQTTQPPNTAPPNSGRLQQLEGASTRVANCFIGGQLQHYVGDIDGRKSGIVFEPGRKFTVHGCGFGAGGGQIKLVSYQDGAYYTVAPTVDSWSEGVIVAHIDPAFGGVPDLGSINVNVTPSGGSEFGLQAANSFRAAKETIQIPLPANRGNYSSIFRVPAVTDDGKTTIVKRSFSTGAGYCPTWDPNNLPVDTWDVGSFLKAGFEFVALDAVNRTDQRQQDVDGFQEVLLSTFSARYVDSRRQVIVLFQGHSRYNKPMMMATIGGNSDCTAEYAVSLRVRGPRGVAPIK